MLNTTCLDSASSVAVHIFNNLGAIVRLAAGRLFTVLGDASSPVVLFDVNTSPACHVPSPAILLQPECTEHSAGRSAVADHLSK